MPEREENSGVDRKDAETFARRRADRCDRLAATERELANRARVKAQSAHSAGQAAWLERLARVHDQAAAQQAEAAAYYYGLADRVAVQ
jgi:hypothetical protein